MAATPLRVVRQPAAMDLAEAERAAADLLHALGIETESESLRGTPGRMVRAYAELFSSDEFDLTTFPNDEGYDELVLARSIPLRSVCEHPTMLGLLREDARCRQEFFALARIGN